LPSTPLILLPKRIPASFGLRPSEMFSAILIHTHYADIALIIFFNSLITHSTPTSQLSSQTINLKIRGYKRLQTPAFPAKPLNPTVESRLQGAL
jgi:hypothetical protein